VSPRVSKAPAEGPSALPPMVATRRRSPKQSELIARDLASYIVDSNLPAGTPLPPEREMVQSLGVGRTTLREALLLLETRGVITIRSGPRGGPLVRRPNPRDLSEGLSLILQFEKADLTVMMEARSALEPAAARMAATRITPDTLTVLRENNQAILEAAGDVEAFFTLNREFHRVIAEASGNIVVRIFVESIMSIADGQAAGIVYGRRQIQAIVEAHDRVIEALSAGDAQAAEAAMNEHLEDSHRYWRRRYGQLLTQTVSWIR
jgi:GntR family transcriptional regulator, transcriptional repressor for pyruvate dehydrogenase complex